MLCLKTELILILIYFSLTFISSLNLAWDFVEKQKRNRAFPSSTMEHLEVKPFNLDLYLHIHWTDPPI